MGAVDQFAQQVIEFGISGIIVIGGSSFLGFKFYQYVKPFITNESKIVDLTNSNNVLADAVQQLNITMIKITSEHQLETSLIKKDVAYIKEDIDDIKEDIKYLKERIDDR